MAEQPPFKPGNTFNTPLSPLDEMAFRQWVSDNKVPFDVNAPVSDYDMRGYWSALRNRNPMALGTEINQNDGRPHYTDYFKTPLHRSFSNESQWADQNSPAWVSLSQLADPSGRVIFDERPSAFARTLANIGK